MALAAPNLFEIEVDPEMNVRFAVVDAEAISEPLALTSAAASEGLFGRSVAGEVKRFLVVRVLTAVIFDRRGEPREPKRRRPRRRAGESDQEFTDRTAAASSIAAAEQSAKPIKTGKKATPKKKPRPLAGESDDDYQARVREWQESRGSAPHSAAGGKGGTETE